MCNYVRSNYRILLLLFQASRKTSSYTPKPLSVTSLHLQSHQLGPSESKTAMEPESFVSCSTNQFWKDKQLSTSTTICNVLHNVTCTTLHSQLQNREVFCEHINFVHCIEGQCSWYLARPRFDPEFQVFSSATRNLKPLLVVSSSNQSRLQEMWGLSVLVHSQRAKTSIQSILYSQRTHSKKTQVSSPSSAGCCSGKGILAWEGHNSTTLPQWSGEFFVDLQCSNLHELWSLQCTLKRQVQILAIYIWGYEKSTSLSFQPFPSFPDRNLKPDTATPPAFADWGASTSIHSAKNSGGLCEGWAGVWLPPSRWPTLFAWCSAIRPTQEWKYTVPVWLDRYLYI